MYAYLSLLFNICLFKKGPQDIPYSDPLFRLSIISFALINYLLTQLSINGFRALLQVGVEIIIMISFAKLLLFISNKLKRFSQTLCALLGTDALFSMVAIPVISSLIIDKSNTLASLTMLALMLWNWLVTAHIIRNAIDKPFSFAAGIVILYIVSASYIMGTLFPPSTLPA